MDVVGATQLDRAPESRAERRPLDHDHRDDEPDQREPGNRRQDERERQQGERQERNDTGEPGSRER